MASVRGRLDVSVGMDEHVNRSLAEKRRFCAIQAQPMNLRTPGSTVHLTCRSWRRRRRTSSRFNYSFFSLFDIQPSLSLPVGSREVTPKPFFWLRFSEMQFWPPEELPFSLAHVKALYHLSFWNFLVLSVLRSLSDLSLRGLVKLPGKNNSKHWTGPASPVSCKLLQTFVSLKWRVHWKEVCVFLPKGQLLPSFLRSCKVIQYKFIGFQIFTEHWVFSLIYLTCWSHFCPKGVHFYSLFLERIASMPWIPEKNKDCILDDQWRENL